MAAIDVPLAFDTDSTQDAPATTSTAEQTPATTAQPQTKTGLKSPPKAIPVAPSRSAYPNAPAPASALLRSSSPRLNSPASSEIFERSVQEPIPISTLEGEPKAHLATHVITEDFIPPALEASAQAITSQELGADEVEIVTSTTHQTAAASVLESSTSQLDLSSLNSAYSSQKIDDTESVSQSGLLPPIEDEATTTYGSIDPNDLRRLSFISFADVVHAEHQHPAAPVASEAGNSPPLAGSVPNTAPRSRSPFRSPTLASQTTGLATPPLSATRHVTGAEQSPARHLAQPGVHGELTIETMRQAVRKTASGDIGQNFRSTGMSPISSNDDTSGSRSRTNT